MTDATDARSDSPSEASSSPAALSALLALACLLGPLALAEARAAVFAVLLLIIALAALTRHRGRARPWLRLGLVTSLVLAILGLGRFVLKEALPGIVEASGRATGDRAVSRLREILFAQDASRRLGLIDPDGNGIGGAGRLAELTGANPPRPTPGKPAGTPLPHPPLGPLFRPRVTTPHGPAAEEGDYLFLVCVPGRDGRLTAFLDAEVDEAAAERRFVAYAWPAQPGGAQTGAFFIDEHERILETDNAGNDGSPRLWGPERAPDCHDALEPPHAATWRPWRNKQPRKSLPGL